MDTLKQDPRITLAPTQSSAIWIEFVGFEKPDRPFHDKRVRQAVSLALDRKAISDAEEGGLSTIVGNWLPENWPGAIKGPTPEYDVPKAKQLMAEAGFPNSFEVESLTPFPPFYSLGERVITALRDRYPDAAQPDGAGGFLGESHGRAGRSDRAPHPFFLYPG